jgi:hypothetical protein
MSANHSGATHLQQAVQYDSGLEGLAHRTGACEDKVEYVCIELAALKQEDSMLVRLMNIDGPHHTRRWHTSRAKSRTSKKG